MQPSVTVQESKVTVAPSGSVTVSGGTATSTISVGPQAPAGVIVSESKLSVVPNGSVSVTSSDLSILSVGTQGPAGPAGSAGAAGPGVASGGTINQALVKIDATNYNTQWNTIDKTFVGLGNVDNISDINKPVSSAQGTADALRVLKAGDTMTGPLTLANGTEHAEIGLDSSYRLIIGHAYIAGDNMSQIVFRYYTTLNYKDKGIRLEDVGNGITTVISQTGSGSLYWVDGVGNAGSLAIGSVRNPSDGLGIVFTYGLMTVGNTTSFTRSVGIGVTAPNSLLQVAGPIATAIANRTAAYTITATDSIITADATTAVFTVNLPTAVGIAGRAYTVKKIDASANAVTMGTTSAQTIDGATTYALSVRWKYATVVSDGANWLITANN